MSIASEISRLQTAKSDLKTSINAKTDAQHQITTETIDEYADFVDSISGGSPSVDVASTRIRLAYSNFTTVPSIFDFSGNFTSFNRMFSNCLFLTTLPSTMNTANATSFEYAFCNCEQLTSIPSLNTSTANDFGYMFYYCSKLTSIPSLNTSNATIVNYMFQNCARLTTIPQLDFGKVISIGKYTFRNSTALTTLGGFVNLGKAYATSSAANYSVYIVDFSTNTSLTHDSLMNVINNLYDIATKGCNTQSLTLGSTNLAKLTAEEISTATNKGWTVS